MKKLIFTLAATVIIAGIVLTGCNSSSKRIENSEEEVMDARVRDNSMTDFRQFKTESQNQISANEKSIARLKLNIEDVNQNNRDVYEKKLAELEERNSALKIKLAEYDERETDEWQEFKSEFKRDMDELGRAFSDFTDNNITVTNR